MPATTAYRSYLLVLLMIIEAFNFIDRLALGVVMQDMKLDLRLSDTQLGLLSGLTFAVFYSVMGIPIARWADRGNRVTIIGVTTGLWSAAVALCGVATSFVQLLFIRIGVGVGEAGCKPPALSLISDCFSRAERPRAVSRYELGWPIALLVGYFAAGWLNQFYGWRTMFIAIGLPGLILAGLAALTLREPRRAKHTVEGHAPTRSIGTVAIPEQPKLKEVFTTLWSNPAYRYLLFAQAAASFFTDGIMQWQPAFFIRTHGLQTGELGTWLAIAYGIGGLLGTWFGGEMAARYAANNERLQLKAIAVLYMIFGVLIATVYMTPDYRLAFAIFSVAVFGGAAGNGPIFAASQTLVSWRMRAMSIALVLFFSNLIGLGLGPLAVGALSDALRPWLGEESLRYSLVAFCPGYFWAAWHFWQSSRTASQVAAAHAADENAADSEPSALRSL